MLKYFGLLFETIDLYVMDIFDFKITINYFNKELITLDLLSKVRFRYKIINLLNLLNNYGLQSKNHERKNKCKRLYIYL